MRKVIILICLLCLVQFAVASNNVEVHINNPQDLLVVGDTSIIEFWLENDFLATAISIGFEFSGYSGIVIWDSLYGSNKPINVENDAIGILIHNVLFDTIPFYNGSLPDSIVFGGVYYPGLFPGLPVNSSRICYSMQLYIPAGEPGGEFCVDNIYYPPAGAWLFTNPGGVSVAPDFFECVNESTSNPDCPAFCFDVDGRPEADFTFIPDSGEVPVSVQFTDLSLHDPTSWQWTFGDGGSSSLQNPQHNYTTVGTFFPRLIVSNVYGVDTMLSTIPVQSTPPPPPIADFSFIPDSGQAPLTVNFTDLSLNDPTSWNWNFGDVGTSTAQNPQHIYTSLGSFYPRLIVSHTYGADTLTSTTPVIVTAPPSPIADFSFTPDSGEAPLTVTFTDLSLNDPTSWNWTFGDGGTSTAQNPQHVYTSLGEFYPRLIVSHTYGADTLTSTIPAIVTAPPAVIADFIFSPECGYVPLSVQFNDMSLNDPTSWTWTFGDGGTSTSQNPLHIYQSTGIYYPRLIVSHDYSTDTLESFDPIVVYDVMINDFAAYPTRGSIPFTVIFDLTQTGAPDSYYWTFGDGNTSGLAIPEHMYTTPGEFDVMLVAVKDHVFCIQEDTINKPDFVYAAANDADFTGMPVVGSSPLYVQFNDQSTGTPTSWYWDFGDGNTSTLQNPANEYHSSGYHDVFLRVSDGSTTDSITKLNYVFVENSDYADLFAEIYDVGARPGFDLSFYCVWTNIGTISADNCTLMILPPPDMIFSDVIPGDINSGTYSGYTMSGDTIVISLGSISPTYEDGGYVEIQGSLPGSVPVGTYLECRSWLSSSTFDANDSNNDALHQIEVTGSIEGDNKLAYPEGEGVLHEILPDQRLNYRIDYENTSSATEDATYIIIVDTLDPNLDWSTLEFGASSHPDDCIAQFNSHTGEILWFCDSIMLPPNQTPPEGEGYVTYSITPLSDLDNHTSIYNTAQIKYDHSVWVEAPDDGPVLRTIKFPYICGDADGSERINVSDAVFIVNYIFVGGPEPDPYDSADVTCDGRINISDVVYLINYIFVGGTDPCHPSGYPEPDC
jgi:PKD repeat protein